MWRFRRKGLFVQKQDLSLQDGRGHIVLWETKPGAVHGKKLVRHDSKNYPEEDKKLRQSNNAEKVA